MVQKSGEGSEKGYDSNESVTKIKHKGGHEGKALIVGHFGGDGTYPVYVKKDADGLIRSLEIRFNE